MFMLSVSAKKQTRWQQDNENTKVMLKIKSGLQVRV